MNMRLHFLLSCIAGWFAHSLLAGVTVVVGSLVVPVDKVLVGVACLGAAAGLFFLLASVWADWRHSHDTTNTARQE